LELGTEALINDYLSLGGTFSYMHWKTKTDTADTNLTDAPKWQGGLYAVIKPISELSIIPQIDYTSSFYYDADPTEDHNKAPGFVTADLKATYDINEHFTVEVGAKNIFDKNVYYGWYYPQPGRSYFIGVTATY
jgi:iron complex outermembrane receptor protein